MERVGVRLCTSSRCFHKFHARWVKHWSYLSGCSGNTYKNSLKGTKYKLWIHHQNDTSCFFFSFVVEQQQMQKQREANVLRISISFLLTLQMFALPFSLLCENMLTGIKSFFHLKIPREHASFSHLALSYEMKLRKMWKPSEPTWQRSPQALLAVYITINDLSVSTFPLLCLLETSISDACVSSKVSEESIEPPWGGGGRRILCFSFLCYHWEKVSA